VYYYCNTDFTVCQGFFGKILISEDNKEGKSNARAKYAKAQQASSHQEKSLFFDQNNRLDSQGCLSLRVIGKNYGKVYGCFVSKKVSVRSIYPRRSINNVKWKKICGADNRSTYF